MTIKYKKDENIHQEEIKKIYKLGNTAKCFEKKIYQQN